MNQLASVDSPMIEDDSMAVRLKSMPKEYDNQVTTLKYGPNPSFEGIISALQEEERKKEKQKDEGELALATKFKRMNFKACKHCGKNNHDEKDCFRIKPCGICGKNGHSENNCFSKKNSANMVEEINDESAFSVDELDFCF